MRGSTIEIKNIIESFLRMISRPTFLNGFLKYIIIVPKKLDKRFEWVQGVLDTGDKLSQYCAINNISGITIVGAQKTIDNDLAGTDHCPGFGSAAKYIGTTSSELERDCNVANVEKKVPADYLNEEGNDFVLRRRSKWH